MSSPAPGDGGEVKGTENVKPRSPSKRQVTQRRTTYIPGSNSSFSMALAPPKPKPSHITGLELFSEYRVIDSKWKYKLRWDAGMLILLAFVALVTPFEVAFMRPGYGALFAINRFIDFIFVLDLIFNFFVVYTDPDTNKTVYDLKRIVTHYIRGWFGLDLVSAIPYDWFVTGEIGGPSQLHLLRVMKLLRLGRIWKLLKESGYLDERSRNIDYNVINLIGFIVLIGLVSHWGACFWRLIPEFEDADENWLVVHGYNDVDYSEDLTKVMDVYVASLYWSAMTVTTIGYGDVIPTTTAERFFDVWAMLAGGLIFGYIIGRVGNVVQQRNARQNEYYLSMNNLKVFMQEQKLPFGLQKEINDYYVRLMKSMDMGTYQHYLNTLSPALRGKLLVCTNNSWISRVQHFKDAPTKFIIEVTSILTRHLFAPQEIVIAYGLNAAEIYIINRGIAAGNNRLFTVGNILGHDALVRAESKRLYSAHAITFLECNRLDKNKLFKILEGYPDTALTFRLLAIKNIFREEVMAYCVAMRQIAKRAKEAARPHGTNQPRPLHADNEVIPVSRLSNLEKERSSAAMLERINSRNHEQADAGQEAAYKSVDDMTQEEFEEYSLRMRDLFDKSERTDFYTRKLEILNPATDEERRALQSSVLRIQRYIRRWKRRKNLAIQQEEERRREEEAGVSGSGMWGEVIPEVYQTLSHVQENQHKMMMWLSQLEKQQVATSDDLKGITKKVLTISSNISRCLAGKMADPAVVSSDGSADPSSPSLVEGELTSAEADADSNDHRAV